MGLQWFHVSGACIPAPISPPLAAIYIVYLSVTHRLRTAYRRTTPEAPSVTLFVHVDRHLAPPRACRHLPSPAARADRETAGQDRRHARLPRRPGPPDLARR